MANLNLSEFGEKLFVADADHTFIWDSAASISKRVSRNSWLNSGTLTSDAPVTISQTWNNAAVAFTGLKVNAAGTSDANSASSSLLADFQVGGVSKFTVRKDGAIVLPYGYAGIVDGSVNGGGTNYTWGGPRFGPTAFIAWTATSPIGTADTILLRDGAANTLALRNGAAAQTFNIYNTYQNAGVDYERIAFKWSANLFTIGREFGGTGGARNIRVIGGGSVVGIGEAASAAVDWTFSVGSLLAGTDNTRDIGASGANRPRNVYVGSRISCTDFFLNSNVYFTVPSSGVLLLQNGGASDFNRLQLGGTADAFPAIARDGAGIKFTGAAAGSTAWIKVPPVAVTALPVAATAGVGARAFVNDALSPVFGSAVANGGSAKVPVYSDGSAWYVG